LVFQARYGGRSHVEYALPGGLNIRLYPKGEIAEFLAFPSLFEKTEITLAAAFLKPGMSVIDVGANIGLYSILASLRVGPTGTVWAFEPSSESAARLERNLALNGCERTPVFRLALSNTPSASLSLISDKGYGDAYRYLRPDADPAAGEVVPVTTLDAWAAANAIQHVDFLKVDIEGGEYRMLLGARDFLASNPKIVVMFECETDWCARAGCRPQDLYDLFKSLGFGLYAWDGRSRHWDNDPNALAGSRMLWATRYRSVLPAPASD
jgi:FkbM family methyltransferase